LKDFLIVPKNGESASPEHFASGILPDLESLYASIRPFLQDKRPFLYLCSTEKGEGSSTIARALAYFIAMREGEDCLYVDGNSSHPSITISPDMPQLGLVEYLRGEDDFRLFPFSTEFPGLSAVHCGEAHRHFVSLNADRARAFRDAATRDYRAVIFDSKPGYDRYSEMWAGLADSVMIVASYRSTKSAILNRMTDGFRTAGIPMTGLIFNKRQYPIPEFIYRRV
jgi:Mrp family chromosome partitioning ATPase